ncbi:coiled-coil domain-containing protein 30 isoform X2 [Anabas testudineus]|uniref:coiled-coil domain-containing protein 30 isoform X2 n=1 Tax=Anabas testudineus TaxID=64144 RepID=UPI000E45B208|nr:coiled-coil domain-containing protein 30 isoform X2 [Anabas testudineus]
MLFFNAAQMAQSQEELEQMATWFSQEGLAPDSPKEAQLCLLWRSHQRIRSRLNCVTRDLEILRSQHLAEMAEVRKSLEQIRIFTEQKDVVAQAIQDENDQLKEQLQRLISLQDAQVSEVAKMLYQQGLTELIHSSSSEQVAYLLVERASLLEMSEVPDKLTCDGNTTSSQGTERKAPNSYTCQSPHREAPHHGQSPWKRLFGLHKASQSKCTFIPAEARQFTGQASSAEREFSHLERDLEEGSRRLAMAHSEIRRLTDELESAHLTQRAYEPEMQAAQQEVEQLRQEVEKLKTYEMVELRKAKEMNDRLDLEIRALRNRVRSLDAEKISSQQLVVCLQKEVERLQTVQSEAAELVQSHTTCRNLTEKLSTQSLLENKESVISLQREVERLESALQEQQQQTEQQLQSVQIQANQANELAKSRETELNQSQQICRDLQNKLHAQTRCLLERETEECSDNQEAVGILLSTQDECEALKKEICETLKCLDTERSKYHEMKEKHKAKLCRAKQKLDDETMWRDEKIKSLERELSLCSHSLAKQKELVTSITEENEKLLFERRRLLQHLNEEEHNKSKSNQTASLSKCRVDFLEMENKKLGNKILHMCNQLAVLERTLQNMQSLHFAEELKKIYNPQQMPSHTLDTSSVVMMPEPCEIRTLLDGTLGGHTKQAGIISSPYSSISSGLSRSAEMGYLNLTSTQSHSDHSSSPAALSSSESTVCVSEVCLSATEL